MRIFSKADIILSVVLLCISVGMIIFSLVPKTEGKIAVIKIDNEVFAEYPLDTELEKIVTTKHGYNKVVIKRGNISVIEADCPDGYCVEHTPADEVGETVVCLPHRLVIEIKE